ncbi:MAG: citramalate synthase [Anaerolineaceae bacterium]|nr:citramalate synthase [Anaerolineaceae bacterium]
MIEIYDTTLRDGTQRKDISLSCDDKLRIAQRLDKFGVDFIEGGWPGSNPKDVEFFTRAARLPWQHALIAAFGSTCRAGSQPQADANLNALLESQTPVCTIFGKTWTLHVTEVLRTTLPENLNIIEASVAYLRSQNRRVIYDAEHFFDGYKADPAYALETLRAAARGGAERVVLCDTNGGCLPHEVSQIISALQAQINVPLGIHAHNDGECAVANSLAAIAAGVGQVQGTINGYGERCGNANLCSILPDLHFKLGIESAATPNLAELFDLSHYVAEIANLAPDEYLPYVGQAAFAHKGGVHVSAIRRNVTSYQHIDPALVGNAMSVVVSELAGKSNLLSKAEEHGLADMDNEQVNQVLSNIKELESRGFSFEAAEASALLLLRHQDPNYLPPFELIDFSVNVEHRQKRGIIAEAMVKVKVGDDVLHTAGEGNGPVHALDVALRKALIGHYPAIEHFHLTDYKVRILNGNAATEAVTRVLIDTQNSTSAWSTVGASANIIEASWQALSDSFEYGLLIKNGTSIL